MREMIHTDCIPCPVYNAAVRTQLCVWFDIHCIEVGNSTSRDNRLPCKYVQFAVGALLFLPDVGEVHLCKVHRRFDGMEFVQSFEIP